MISGIYRQMLLLRSEDDQFRGFAVYVRDCFLLYIQRGYECGCYEVLVVKICSSSLIFMCSVYAGI